MSEYVGPSPVAAPVLAMPALALPQLISLTGAFPARGGKGPPCFYQGMVAGFAGRESATVVQPAHGQMLSVEMEESLFSVLGASFGGDGKVAFALPNLRGLIPIGGSPGKRDGPTLVMNYVIAAVAGGVAVGSIAPFGGNFTPPGWLPCDGSIYGQGSYPELHKVIGTVFGGGSGRFAVPNLKGRAVVGTGSGPGLPPVSLGESVAGPVPGLGLTAMIAAVGLYPSAEGPDDFHEHEPFLSQVTAFAGPQPPAGWLPCDGRLLAIPGHVALFSLIGAAYGGDGTTSFALPDLRGRMMAGN